MAWTSADVTADSDATSTQYNALRADLLAHKHTREVFVPCLYSTNNAVGTSNTAVMGRDLRDGANNDYAYAVWAVPTDYSSGISITPVFFGANGGTSGNIYTTFYFTSGATAEATNTHNGGVGWVALALVANQFKDGATVTSVTIAALGDVTAGDRMGLVVDRYGAHASDTFIGVAYFVGFKISYTSSANAAA